MSNKKDPKHKIPAFALGIIGVIGIVYLILIIVIENFIDVAPSTLVFGAKSLEASIWRGTTILWGIGLVAYSVYSIHKGVKDRVRLTFKKIKTFLFEVTISFVGAWYISSLIIISACDTYNGTDTTPIETETIQLITHVNSEVKHSGGSRGSSSTRYYSFHTNSSYPVLKKITTSNILYSFLGEGSTLELRHFKGRLNNPYTEVRIPENNINSDIVNWRGEALSKLIDVKLLPAYFFYFGSQFLFLLFICLLFGETFIGKAQQVWRWKGFLLITFFPVPFLVFLYFFAYDAFASLVVLATMWMGMWLSVGLSYKFYESLYSYIIKVQSVIGAVTYYILIIIIFTTIIGLGSFLFYAYIESFRHGI